MSPRLWITYAWIDNEEGDFDYVVQRLEEVGVDARYDRVALVPGQRLWEQIASHILDPATLGWAWLLTPASVRSEACVEEFSYALDRALDARGAFPLIGLLHDVPAEAAPPAIRARLAVPLADPAWPTQVMAGLHGRAPEREPSVQLPFTVTVHSRLGGGPDRAAIEVRPRLEHFPYWRIAVPPGCKLADAGDGPSGGYGPAGVQFEHFGQGATIGIEDQEWPLGGTKGPLTPTTSGYAIVVGPHWPERLFFGTGQPGGATTRGWFIDLDSGHFS